MFIPDKETRHCFDIFFDTNDFSTPEAFLHFQTLLRSNEDDTYGYSVLKGKYVPKHYLKECALRNIDPQTQRPLIMQTQQE